MLHAGKAQVSRTHSLIEHTAQQEAHSQKGTQPERHTARKAHSQKGTQPEEAYSQIGTQPGEAHSQRGTQLRDSLILIVIPAIHLLDFLVDNRAAHFKQLCSAAL
jgi:hypothetical protein